MHMIGHEAICPYFNFIAPAGNGHHGNILAIIIIAEKGLHPAVAPLGNMVGYSRYDDPCYPCHELRLITYS